jgi:hypothetical protein
MLQMDSQWTTLLRSYRDNYLEYKVTGDPKYKQSVDSAQEGLDNILNILKGQLDDQNKTLAEFNASNTQSQLNELKNQEADLRQGMLEQEDMLTTAQIRQSSSTNIISKNDMIGLGVLTAITIGLSLM